MSKRLGRGLASLITTGSGSAAAPHGAAPSGNGAFAVLPTHQIRPGRYQPRTTISPSGLEELKQSIKKQGVLEPVLVRPLAHGTYELVAGERRWRAAQALGIKEVPAIIRQLTDQQMLEYSLIENIQREDLNPLEEARGYARLLDEFGYTQEDIASAVGKDRATVANLLRLLKLPPEVQHALAEGRISAGHAKILASIENPARQVELLRLAVKGKLSVRELEVAAASAAGATRQAKRAADPQLSAIEQQLRQTLGTKVRVIAQRRGGRIVVEYYSAEDLTRIMQVMRLSTG